MLILLLQLFCLLDRAIGLNQVGDGLRAMIYFCAEWLVVHYDYVVIVVSGSSGCLHSMFLDI